MERKRRHVLDWKWNRHGMPQVPYEAKGKERENTRLRIERGTFSDRILNSQFSLWFLEVNEHFIRGHLELAIILIRKLRNGISDKFPLFCVYLNIYCFQVTQP